MERENPIFRSLALIEENIQERLTVAVLAESVHFSKYHYQRMFREVVGDSVMRYVARRRLSKAAAELAETNNTILNIALKYGYDSHEGFTRSFRAYMGITPTEYRKYHLSISSPKMEKEKCAMLYSKTTNEIICELNSLIVQAKETAEETRKNSKMELAACYVPFWDFIAARTDTMADQLAKNLEHITAIAQQPDEISARFMIIKTIESIVFESNIIAFQTGLMMARAKPEHRIVFRPLCDKYFLLSQNAQIKADRITEFFKELSALIFQDMRNNTNQKIQAAAGKGKLAAEALTSAVGGDLTNCFDFPYGYLAEEVLAVAEELANIPLEEVTISGLEDFLARLDIVSFSADMDIFRMPSHKSLLEGIHDFRNQVEETVELFRGISGSTVWEFSEQESNDAQAVIDRRHHDIAFQANALLFYLKGELQKLGSRHLNDSQKAVFDTICNKLNKAVQLVNYAESDKDIEEVINAFQAVCKEMSAQAEMLGEYGGAILYIAEEIQRIIQDLVIV